MTDRPLRSPNLSRFHLPLSFYRQIHFYAQTLFFKEVVFPVNSKRFKNIGFISTRIARTDGVSLEIEKWASVLERNDYVLAGVEPSYLIDIHRLSFQKQVFLSLRTSFSYPKMPLIRNGDFSTVIPRKGNVLSPSPLWTFASKHAILLFSFSGTCRLRNPHHNHATLIEGTIERCEHRQMPSIEPLEDSGGPVAALIFQGVCQKTRRTGKCIRLMLPKTF